MLLGRLQRHAEVNTTGDYEGLLVEPATTGAVGRQLQSALTKEVVLKASGENAGRQAGTGPCRQAPPVAGATPCTSPWY
jgi:hypothetical protein